MGSVTITGYRAAPGWDPVTGWGSPDAQVLVPLRSVTRRCYLACPGAVSGDQAQVACAGYGLGAVGGTELAQDVGHVLFDRVERHH
jgi:hypothetical protein